MAITNALKTGQAVGIFLLLGTTVFALGLPDMQKEFKEGTAAEKILEKYEEKKIRQILSETSNLAESFQVATNDGKTTWQVNTPNTPASKINYLFRNARKGPGKIITFRGNSLERFDLLLQSPKGVVVQVKENGNPFSAIMFFRVGTVSEKAGQFFFKEADARKGIPKGGEILPFTYLCFDGTSEVPARCAEVPTDLFFPKKNTPWKEGNPVGRVPLSEWNLNDKALKKLLSESPLFKTQKPLFVYAQQPSVSKEKFQEMARLGIEGVIFNLAAQSENKKADPKAFAQSLKDARGVYTPSGKPVRGIAWVNNLEDNNRLDQLPLTFCTSKGSKRKRACIDDPKTLDALVEHYEGVFSKLSLELKKTRTRDLLAGISLDYEMTPDCICGSWLTRREDIEKEKEANVRSKKLQALRKQNTAFRNRQASTLFTKMKKSIQKHLGSVPVYLHSDEIGPSCRSAAGIDYVETHKKNRILPAPYTFAPFEAGGKVAKNSKACFSKAGIKNAVFPLPIFMSPEVGKPACQEQKTAEDAFAYALSQPTFGAVALFEYGKWFTECPDVCPDFIEGCKEYKNIAKAADSKKATA